MKTTFASILGATAVALVLSGLQPVVAQEYAEPEPYLYEGEEDGAVVGEWGEENVGSNGDWGRADGNNDNWYQGNQQRGYQDSGYQGGQQGAYPQQGYQGGQQGGYYPQGGQQDGYQNNENPFGGPKNPPGSQVVQLVDQNSPYGPVVAFQHAIPPGWQANGQVIWTQREVYPGCGYDDNYYRWSARSRDGRQELGYWPQVIYSGFASQYFSGNPMRGCENVLIRNPKAFLTAHVKRVRPGARIKSYVPPTSQEAAQLRQAVPPMQRVSPDTTASWDIIGARFILSYEENGVSFDEFVIVGAVTYNLNTTGMMASETKITAVIPTFYMRAPSGQLDEQTAIAYSNAMHANPQYLQMLKSISDAKAKKNAQRMQARSRAMASAGSKSGGSAVVDFSTADILDKGWKARSASSDASQARMAASAGGVARYTDPQSNTGYFETEVGKGDRVFRLDNGSTVVTDDYFYNQGAQLTPMQ